MTIKKFADIRKICSYLGKTLSLNLQKTQALTGYNTHLIFIESGKLKHSTNYTVSMFSLRFL